VSQKVGRDFVEADKRGHVKFAGGGMVRKHGSPTDCGPMCRDSKTVR